MRLLYLEETPIIEIQEAKEGTDLWISLGNIEFQYARESKSIYQYQDGPTNKEIKEKQEAIKALPEGSEEREEAAKEFIQWMKDNSKKILYKVTTPKGNLVDVLESIIGDEKVEKEYLD